ncbi:MAG TPA: NAD(+)/NADH kinase [Syntrophorhabdales bacterium]|nr:NAD(+)/NADH kinase [Syntrophorhabdales bacterium]
MKNIAIFAKVQDPRCQGVAVELVQWLRDRGLTPLPEEHLARRIGFRETMPANILDLAELIVVLGGDGTLISVARIVGKRGVPIFGVNLGSLGFLTEITLDELYPALESCLKGDYHISERMMLSVAVERDGELISENRVLNDAVINKGALARIIDLETTVNDDYLTTFKGDGVILSTPTGSTGYSLSANGPILYPELDCFVVSPICPHTLTNRPLVVRGDAQIRVELKCINEDVCLTLDGQVGMKLECGDVIRISRSKQRTRLIISGSRDYFEILRTKLKWGER